MKKYHGLLKKQEQLLRGKKKHQVETISDIESIIKIVQSPAPESSLKPGGCVSVKGGWESG